MDAEHLIRAQSEAAAAACAGLSAIYRARADLDPQAWLDVAATELWRFAGTLKRVAPAAAAWVSILDEHADAPLSSLGVGFADCLTPAQKHAASRNVQRLIGFACPKPNTDQLCDPKDPPDSAVNGMLHARVSDDAGGSALVLGGLMRTDGRLDESAAEDELLTTMFHAVATAAADQVVSPRSARRRLLARLTGAQERVLGLMIEGLTNQEMARRLDRSPHTVHDHVMGVFRALGVNSRRAVNELWYDRTPLAAIDGTVQSRPERSVQARIWSRPAESDAAQDVERATATS